MNEKELRGMVERTVLSELAKIGEPYVPVVSSNRHVHLTQEDVERLFGAGYQLTKMRDLVQPGQFACNERVTIETDKGRLALRVVGPTRKETQVELSLTDAAKLGLTPPIRMSGELEGSAGCTLVNGERRIALPRGVIVAARHLHLAPDEALAFGLQNGDVVSLAVSGMRATVLNNVAVRTGAAHLMEAHIDKDEANACGLTDGQLCRVIKSGEAQAASAGPSAAGVSVGAVQAACATARAAAAPLTYVPAPKPAAAPAEAAKAAKSTMLDLSYESRRLITESDVRDAARDGYKMIRYAHDAILTPLARDAASAVKIELIEIV